MEPNIISIEDIISNSFGNMDDDQFDNDLKLFRKICKYFNATEQEVVCLTDDTGEYDPVNYSFYKKESPIKNVSLYVVNNDLEVFVENINYNSFIYAKDEDSINSYIAYIDSLNNTNNDLEETLNNFKHGNVILNEDLNLVAKEFNYNLKIGDNAEEISSAVIVIPDGLSYAGETIDAVIYPEDENGNVIDFKSVEDAQSWIDENKDNISLTIKHGDEVHAIPLHNKDNLIEKNNIYDKIQSATADMLKLSKEEWNNTGDDDILPPLSDDEIEDFKLRRFGFTW